MLDGQEALTTLPGSDQRVIWVPQRQLLKHALFTVPGKLSGRKRLSALQLKIEAWSPYLDTGYAVAWSGNDASVFAWDREALSARITELGFDPSTCEVVPEAFLSRPIESGVRLVKCVDGVEAQVWKEGFLHLTRWWASVPPKHEWSLFARTAGTPGNLEAPPPQNPDWLELPWNEAALSSNMLTQATRNDRLVATAIALLLAPCFFYTFKWLTYSAMTATNARTISSVEEESRPIRADRSMALTAIEMTEDLISLNPYPHHIEVIARTHDILRPFPITLANWDYDKGTLEFGILSEMDLDARVLITAFEDDDMFSSVSSSTIGQRLVLRMDISTSDENSI